MEGRNTTSLEGGESYNLSCFSEVCPYCGMILECSIPSRLIPVMAKHKITCKKELNNKKDDIQKTM